MKRSALTSSILIICMIMAGISFSMTAIKIPLPGKAGVKYETRQSISVNPGKIFAIYLDSNPTTGYSWRISSPYDKSVVALVSSLYLQPKRVLPGAAGLEEWKFRARREGSTVLLMEYARPWERNKPPAVRQTINIFVK